MPSNQQSWHVSSQTTRLAAHIALVQSASRIKYQTEGRALQHVTGCGIATSASQGPGHTRAKQAAAMRMSAGNH